MKRRIRKFVVLLCGLIFAGCQANVDKATDLNVGDFADLLERTADIQLVDVRTAGEYAQGHLRNALLIDVTASDFSDRVQAVLDPEIPVAVYCRSGKRGARAAGRLRRLGFTKVYNLQGGFVDWQAEGQAYEK